MTSTTRATPDRDRRERNARIIVWIGLLIAAALCAVASFVVDTGILWEHSTGCEPGPADPDEVWAGRAWQAVVLVAVVGGWVPVWAVLRAHRAAVLACALIGTTPALGYFLYGLDAASWVGGFCIQF